MNHNPSRELYRPSYDETRGAIEILLASSIPADARKVVRQLEEQTAERKAA